MSLSAVCSFSKILNYLDCPQWNREFCQELLKSVKQTKNSQIGSEYYVQDFRSTMCQALVKILDQRQKPLSNSQYCQEKINKIPGWVREFECASLLDAEFSHCFEFLRTIFKIFFLLRKMNKFKAKKEFQSLRSLSQCHYLMRKQKRKFEKKYSKMIEALQQRKKQQQNISNQQRQLKSIVQQFQEPGFLVQECVCQINRYSNSLKHDIKLCASLSCENYFHPTCYRESKMTICKYCTLNSKVSSLLAYGSERVSIDKCLFYTHLKEQFRKGEKLPIGQELPHQRTYKFWIRPSDLLKVWSRESFVVCGCIQTDSSNKVCWPRNHKIYINDLKMCDYSFPEAPKLRQKVKRLSRCLKSSQNIVKVSISLNSKQNWEQSEIYPKAFLMGIFIVKFNQ